MKVGDIINRHRPTFGSDVLAPTSMPKTMPGKVVYIHPERRFYKVEFDFGRSGVIRECFYFKR